MISPLPRVDKAALALWVDFGAEEDDADAAADFAVVGTVVVEIWPALPGVEAAVETAADALVTPLTWAWTLGLNCPDMPLRLHHEVNLNVKSNATIVCL
jgi:hypothetical protein